VEGGQLDRARPTVAVRPENEGVEVLVALPLRVSLDRRARPIGRGQGSLPIEPEAERGIAVRIANGASGLGLLTELLDPRQVRGEQEVEDLSLSFGQRSKRELLVLVRGFIFSQGLSPKKVADLADSAHARSLIPTTRQQRLRGHSRTLVQPRSSFGSTASSRPLMATATEPGRPVPCVDRALHEAFYATAAGVIPLFLILLVFQTREYRVGAVEGWRRPVYAVLLGADIVFAGDAEVVAPLRQRSSACDSSIIRRSTRRFLSRCSIVRRRRYQPVAHRIDAMASGSGLRRSRRWPRSCNTSQRSP
jgi:hypothetical protein